MSWIVIAYFLTLCGLYTLHLLFQDLRISGTA